ncbi:MerR family transcriptional regulator [Rhodococcus sp. X156]|uniref:transcriptional regulator FtsR n=1 Tax=Rhodococcus sp. X156 TaxID=2499145 RepID=UPI000FD8F32E|nr:MerR family transcriptional regulator [Rhodococcus sp. X156]
MTAAGRAQRGGVSIGVVLDELRPDFPDVTISKIRFLESEGLVTPQRTPAGYRQFSRADCERLRFVLTAQRDHYLPLKVIKEQLDAIDKGMVPAHPLRSSRPLSLADASAGATDALVQRESGTHEVRITREELLAQSGLEPEVLDELQRGGVLRTGSAGFYDADSVELAKAAQALAAHGIEPRHLRAFRASAEREAGLLAQVAAPVARRRDSGASARADELVRELTSLSVTVHAMLVKVALRDALGR